MRNRIAVVAVAVMTLAACGKKTEDKDPAPGSDKIASGSDKPPAEVKQIRIAAASNLTKAFQDLGKKFQAETGIEPVFDFGATGMLVRQIKEGAPMDLLASANEAFVDDLLAAGKCDATTKVMYARAPIVIWMKNGGVAPPAKVEDLADPRFASIAIANPETAPYGKAAKQALEKAGIWKAVESRIKLAENITQTFQFAQTGNVTVAFVAQSVVIGEQGGTTLEVPAALHDPIDQAMVVCSTGAAGAAAKKFADYVVSAKGRELMLQYGYTDPGAVSQK